MALKTCAWVSNPETEFNLQLGAFAFVAGGPNPHSTCCICSFSWRVNSLSGRQLHNVSKLFFWMSPALHGHVMNNETSILRCKMEKGILRISHHLWWIPELWSTMAVLYQGKRALRAVPPDSAFAWAFVSRTTWGDDKNTWALWRDTRSLQGNAIRLIKFHHEQHRSVYCLKKKNRSLMLACTVAWMRWMDQAAEEPPPLQECFQNLLFSVQKCQSQSELGSFPVKVPWIHRSKQGPTSVLEFGAIWTQSWIPICKCLATEL